MLGCGGKAGLLETNIEELANGKGRLRGRGLQDGCGEWSQPVNSERCEGGGRVTARGRGAGEDEGVYEKEEERDLTMLRERGREEGEGVRVLLWMRELELETAEYDEEEADDSSSSNTDRLTNDGISTSVSSSIGTRQRV